MERALQLAREAAGQDEAPVGALLVGPEGNVVAEAFDRRMALKDPTAHAEILAMREGAAKLGDWRLEGCTLYVTLEPCPMCAGAAVMARLDRLIYGAVSHKSGAAVSHLKLFEVDTFNHRVEVCGGLMAEECAQVLSDYFQNRRKKMKAEKAGPVREAPSP